MRKNIVIIILGIASILLLVYGLVQRMEMQRQLSLTVDLSQQLHQCERIAEEQRMIAEEQRKIAEMNMVEAMRQRKLAEEASN